jgi:hypothetical protein
MTNTERLITIDRINALLQFDTDGNGCTVAMRLMRAQKITADECNARRADPNRPTYRPVPLCI